MIGKILCIVFKPIVYLYSKYASDWFFVTYDTFARIKIINMIYDYNYHNCKKLMVE